jgi:hypothetical protein
MKFKSEEISSRIIILLILIVALIDCNKKKGLDSTEWKDESLKITASLCEKFRSCADNNWEGVPEKLKDFSKSRLEESHCQKEFRDSNVYKLIGKDPQKMIASYRDCHKKIIFSPCESLRKGYADSVIECNDVKRFQMEN